MVTIGVLCRIALIEGAIPSASSTCWKWVLSVAMAISINFLPWATDIATAESLEPLECDNVSQYYSQASGLTGEQLKAKLHDIVAGHKRLSYAQVLQTVSFPHLNVNFPSLLPLKFWLVCPKT